MYAGIKKIIPIREQTISKKRLIIVIFLFNIKDFSAFFLYIVVYSQVKQDPYHDVCNQYHAETEIVVCWYIQDDIKACEPKNENEGIVLAHPRAHYFMVYVVLVGIEYGFSVFQPHERDSENIEYRHYKQAAGKKQVVVRQGYYIGIFHWQFYQKETQNEAKREAAGIAHEYFCALFCGSEDIEIKKWYEHSHESGNQNAVNPDAAEHEIDKKAHEGDEWKPGWQAVYTVDKVYGVVYEHYSEYGERSTDEKRDVVYSEETVQVVDI